MKKTNVVQVSGVTEYIYVKCLFEAKKPPQRQLVFTADIMQRKLWFSRLLIRQIRLYKLLKRVPHYKFAGTYYTFTDEAFWKEQKCNATKSTAIDVIARQPNELC